MWVGEVGENSNTWAHNKKSFFESKNIGWSWWNFKSLERISSLFSYRKTDSFQRIIDFWQGSGPKPDTLDAFTTLMSFAELTSFDSCDINIGLVRALVDSSFSYVSKPFSSFKPPGQLPAINYDTGNNGVAYFDNQSVDPSKFSPETKSWNNGWTYRNDGVDIGVSNAGIERSYYVGWIEDGEWMIYSLDPGNPTNQKVSLEVASYINGCEVTVEFDSSYVFHKVQLPNTNGWDNGWRTITIGNVSLSGKTKMKIKADTGGFNLKSIIFQNID